MRPVLGLMELAKSSTQELSESPSKISKRWPPSSASVRRSAPQFDRKLTWPCPLPIDRNMSPYSSISQVALLKPSVASASTHAQMQLPPISTLKRPTSAPFLATSSWITVGHRANKPSHVNSNEDWSGLCEAPDDSSSRPSRTISRMHTTPSSDDVSPTADVGQSRLSADHKVESYHNNGSSEAIDASDDDHVLTTALKQRFRCQRTHIVGAATPPTCTTSSSVSNNVRSDSASVRTLQNGRQDRPSTSVVRDNDIKPPISVDMTAEDVLLSAASSSNPIKTCSAAIAAEDTLSRHQLQLLPNSWSAEDHLIGFDPLISNSAADYAWSNSNNNNLPPHPISINVSCFPCNGSTITSLDDQQREEEVEDVDVDRNCLHHLTTSASSASTAGDLLMPPGSCSALSSTSCSFAASCSVNSLSPIPHAMGRNSRRKRALSVSPLSMSNSEGFDLNAVIRSSPTSLVIAPYGYDHASRISSAGSSSTSSLHGNYGHVSMTMVTRKNSSDNGSRVTSSSSPAFIVHDDNDDDVCQTAQNLEQLGEHRRNCLISSESDEAASLFGGGGHIAEAFDNHLVMHQDALQQWEQQLFNNSSEFLRGSSSNQLMQMMDVNDSVDFPQVRSTVKEPGGFSELTHERQDNMLFLEHLDLDDDDVGLSSQLSPSINVTPMSTFEHDERFQTDDFAGFSDWLKYELASKDDVEEDVDTSTWSSSSSNECNGKATSTTIVEVDNNNRCRWIDCSTVCCNREDLVRHIERAHVDQRKGPEDFTCFWQGCPRRHRPFNARYKLLIHMRIHSGEKPNKCLYKGCGKAFSRLENLKIHLRSHTGERPYTCQHIGCLKAFSNSSDRAKHQRTHVDTKPYACQMPGCSKRYTDPSSLRKHVKNHVVKEQKIRKKIRGVQAEVIFNNSNISSSDHFFGAMDPILSRRSSSGGSQSDSNRESPTPFGHRHQPNSDVQANWTECDTFDGLSISPKSEVSKAESQFLRDAILFNNEYHDLCVDEFFDALDAGANRQGKHPRLFEQHEDDLTHKLTTIYADIS